MLVSAPMVCVIHTSAQQTDFTSRTRSVRVCGCVCVHARWLVRRDHNRNVVYRNTQSGQ